MAELNAEQVRGRLRRCRKLLAQVLMNQDPSKIPGIKSSDLRALVDSFTALDKWSSKQKKDG